MENWVVGVWKTINIWIPVINLLFAAAIIFLERRNVGVTWAWLMLLLLLPVFGFIIYIFLGQNLARQKVYRIRARMERQVRQQMAVQEHTIQEGTFHYTDDIVKQYEHLIYMNLMNSASPLTQNNEVTLFIDGVKKFEALLNHIALATEHVHLLYYKVGNDETGKRLLKALTQKAREGVRIRLLYDGIGSLGVNKKLFFELVEAGGEVCPFFPSKIPYLNFRLNYRNHRKIAIIDGKYGFIGGFNIGDEYLGLDRKIGYWRDTHLMIYGDAVHRLQVQFMLDWDVASNESLKIEPVYFPELAAAEKAAVQIVSSGPNSDKQQIKNGYIKLIFEAKKRIYVQTPYFVPDDGILNALRIAILSGIDVRIMIPKKSDHMLVQWASYAYMGDLLREGATCYLYENGFLHAKTIMVDGQAAAVGTANMDHRSFELNFEITAFLYGSEITSRLEATFEQDMENSELLTLENFERRWLLTRAAESMARLLSPIL
ncbi:cardiolipin synthase [Paenibacillus radicis (ex Xue et al. 2023)]|uniref:Cardiolipin synthase n=1 Tax=Paenibacillus radicis (ex Xue et al. 2023) TaxID=2972489 RepID=A0ABT1YS60_9BACL|nr:cardiolipin synthase [Paenibacillus radicis (ex Xue et al. 2023)]MCR8636023.1 cardiolipin synthase [Paenibacillus radicis (ex Xue et al. 2023)]